MLHTYNDVGGKATIGIGHLLGPGESYPNGITLAQAQAMLANDLARFEAAISGGVKVTITQHMFDALASFTYNLGTGALASSTLLKLLNKGDFAGAAAQFPAWDKVDGVPNAEILGRRKREAALFLTPDAAHVAPPPAPPVPTPPVPPSIPAVPVAPPPAPTNAFADFFAMILRLFTGGK